MASDAFPTTGEDLLVSRLVMAVGFDASAPWSKPPPLPRWWVTRAWPRAPHHSFPDYDSLWPQFAADLDDVAEQCTENGRLPPAAAECELRFVNPVTPVEPWPRTSRLERLLLHWFADTAADGLLPTPEFAVADAHFSMPPRGKAPPGRMTIEMRWMSIEGPEPVVGMTLSARSRALDGELGAARAFFDNAFEWIVRGFAAVSESTPVGAPEPGALQRVR